MAWITFTASTVAQRVLGPEMSALKTAARGAGQDGDDLLNDQVSRVIQEIRGRVAACDKNTLGVAGTIPDELEDAAVAIVIFRFCTRLAAAAERLITERREMAYNDALKLLNDVAACRLAIVPPTTPAPDEQQAGGPGITLITSRTPVTKPSQTAGLL